MIELQLQTVSNYNPILDFLISLFSGILGGTIPILIKYRFIDSKKEKKNDLKIHYEDLREDLVSLNQSLSITRNTVEYVPEWRQRIEIIHPMDFPSMHEDVKHHLEKDYPDLLEKIKKCVKIINDHYEKICIFDGQLETSLKELMIQNNIPVSNEPNTGFYFNDGYRRLLDIQLNIIGNCLCNDIPLDDTKSLPITVFINTNGYIQAGNFLIGRGDESVRRRIDELIRIFPYREEILVQFANLYISYEQIKVDISDIQFKLDGLVEKIKRHKYNTRADCCKKFYPT